MAVRPQYLAYILEQLEALGISHRRLFSGVGLYSGERIFGLVHDDTLYFKTDETNCARYQARNMPRFMPPADRPIGPFGYHEVPADIIEDAEALVEWARKSVAVALRSQARKASRKPKPRAKSGSKLSKK